MQSRHNFMGQSFSLVLAIVWGLLAPGLSARGADTPVKNTAANSTTVNSPAVTLPVKSIDQRYADASTSEVPDFREHVVPLLGRLGCNGRACHGSFQGQGGFRLSLFGYDFKADHEGIAGGDKPRTVPFKPEESLFLKKPLMIVDHEGGDIVKPNSWEHHVLRRWIESGAKGTDIKTAPDFVKLHVTPSEYVAQKVGDEFRISAIVEWSDGRFEDVTPLCRFQSLDDQVGSVNRQGDVKITGKGDSNIIVVYDNGVVPVPVMLAVSDKTGPNYPPVPAPTRVDELVVEKLKKLGIIPSDLCNDYEFLRRTSLDITGTLPTVEDIQLFAADKSPNKRARKIDELLESPAYAVWWATRFSDYTGNNANYLQNQGAGSANENAEEWHSWLQKRLAENVPYDDIVAGIVTATSRKQDESFEDYSTRMSQLYWKNSETSFADQDSLVHYWSRRNFQKPEERSLGFAYAFLGVRIQCAECHKHPFDQWTKDDFDRFKAFFTRIRYGERPEDKNAFKEMFAKIGVDADKVKGNDLYRERNRLVKQGKITPFSEVYVVTDKKSQAKVDKKNDKKGAAPVSGRTAKILGGDEIVLDGQSDPREALMDWLRSEENPYFTKAIVNRIWANYFNAGIVNPVDDLSLGNPASNPQLLQYLADGFVQHKYDLKWLHREIANSRTYQLSWETNETNELDERNFSHAVPRRLPAEVAYDAIFQATGSDQSVENLQHDFRTRAISDTSNTRRNQSGNYALTIFGRSTRESNCDCDRSMEPTLLQTVYLQNDSELLATIDRKGGWIDQMIKSTPAAQATETTTSADKLSRRSIEQLRERLKKMESKGKSEESARVANALAAIEAKVKASEAISSTPASLSPEKMSDVVKLGYLRTLSRPPTEEEIATATNYIRESPKPETGIRDLIWALLNTKEFIVNH